ncbi:endospore germination permease [Paenibacillus sp. HB172176]|uniref:GerAB/ArcD/ProY family transporter n=1 Tax=Paenibacillus sp. HB172176 TaxID=2493690 RepID=UPI00143BE011|nr:endospore germination permease [Paenibacillus sp. HB172176]
MKIKPFGIFPALAMMILSVGLINHVLIVPIVLEYAHRDAWIAVLAALIVALPWTAIPLFQLLKKLNHKRLDHWLKERIHPLIVNVVMFILITITLLIGSETLIITTSWTGTTYLPNTPALPIIIVFLGLCVFAASKGLRTIAYVSCLILPPVVLMGDFVLSANMPHKDYRYLLPVMEHGLSPVFTAVTSALTAFSELFALLLIQHHLKKSFKRWHLIALVLFLALLAISPIIGAITQFGVEESEKMVYPAFAQWRLVNIGRYFEHVDFFAIYQWLSGALIRLSLSLYIVVEYTPIHRLKRKWIGYSILSVLLAAHANYFNHDMFHYGKILKYSFQYTGVIMMFIIVLLYGSSFLKRRDGGVG